MTPQTPNNDNQGNDTSREFERARELAELARGSQLLPKEGKPIDTTLKINELPKPDAAPNLQRSLISDVSSILHEDVRAVPIGTPHEEPQKQFEHGVQMVSDSSARQNPATPAAQARAEKVIPMTASLAGSSLQEKSAMLHTLKQDVQGLVQKRKVSMVRAIALDEEERKDLSTIDEPSINRKPTSYTWVYVVSTIFFCIGIAIVGLLYYGQMLQRESAQVAKTRSQLSNAIVFYEHSQPFEMTDLERYEILGGLANVRDYIPSTFASFTALSFFEKKYDPTIQDITEVSITDTDAMNRIFAVIPSIIRETMTGRVFIGVHTTDENAPFILIEVQNNDTALAGMLEWEKDLPRSLEPFFPSRGGAGLDLISGTAATFTDIAVDNIDARILRTPQGDIRMLYAVLQDHVVVITNNLNTLKEAVRRVHIQVTQQ
jgi:hypothetical protein